MTVESSGLLLYRITASAGVEVLIAHMGGPFWERKNERAWSVPKGIHEQGEHDHLLVAEREFGEEMGSPAPPGESLDLGSVRSGNKRITAFARQGDFDAGAAVSNTFEMEWPRGSGIIGSFPEMDRADWVSVESARTLLVKSQVAFLDRLEEKLADMALNDPHTP